ncbi:MAG: hypothetical protein WD626_05120 [Bauldia sp.]
MRNIQIMAGVIVLGVALAGCASGPMVPMVQSEALAWVRTDGQSGRANPALADQFATDRGACGIALAQDNATLRNAEPCMNSRGYVLVPASQAEATAARFRAAGTVPAG